MSEQTVGNEPAAPRPKSAAGRRAPAEDAVIPTTPEGNPKPPLPESLDAMAEAAQPNATKTEAPEAEPAPSPAPSAPAPAFDIASFSAEQRSQLERLSMNLARAAMAAQGAIAEVALKQADRPAALSPDPFNVAPALTDVMGHLAAQPDRLMRAQAQLFTRYMDLWQNTARRMVG
ncbi:MAG: class poly(R)-hydroxyalkanoic acid synthase, partial [Phenylobacterium sp.]|nr:class poly(R)-hydroxyalkanoic acid synthase [Phenylobacterium sp.]